MGGARVITAIGRVIVLVCIVMTQIARRLGRNNITVVGVLLAVGGTALLAAQHGSNSLRLARTHLATPTAAYVASADDVRHSINGFPPHGAQPTVRLDISGGTAGRSVFVGVTPA